MQKRTAAFIFFIFIFVANLNAQSVAISGNVYDISGRRPIESVIVYSSANRAITDSLKH